MPGGNQLEFLRRPAPKPKRPFRLVADKQNEHAFQTDCTKMLRSILLPDVCWTAIDHAHSFNPTIGRNGQPVGLMEMQARKRRGVRAGIPDYAYWHRGRSFAIELKTVDGVLSDDQKDFLKALIAAGAEVSVCWSLDQVFQKVVEWGLVRPGVRMLA